MFYLIKMKLEEKSYSGKVRKSNRSTGRKSKRSSRKSKRSITRKSKRSTTRKSKRSTTRKSKRSTTRKSKRSTTRKSKRSTTRKSKRSTTRKSKRSVRKQPLEDFNIENPELSFKQKNENCISRCNVKLNDVQKRVINYMENNDGLLVVHGVGKGKTLTSIGVAECFLDKNSENKVVLVAPSGLINNFKKEMKKYGVRNEDRYTFYSFDKFFREDKLGNPILCDKNTLLIVDEAHNLRNPKAPYDKKLKITRSSRMNSVLNCSLKAGKRLLLTATPFVNSVQDFIPLINMIYGERILGTPKQQKSGQAMQGMNDKPSEENIEIISKLLKNRVDVVNVDPKDENFPDKIIKYIAVPMSKKYYAKYQKVIASEGEDIFVQPAKFYNGHRRAVNICGGSEYYSDKIKKIAPIIKKQKTIIYSNWIEFGIEPVEKTLDDLGIQYKTISGNTNRKERSDIVDLFNDENSKIQVLIITKAAGEGIDLKRVRNVVILEPTWNPAGLEQIIGRAVRFRSHEGLPKSEQNVNVYLMVSTEPGINKVDMEELEFSDSGDRILYNIIKIKNFVSEQFSKILKIVSI